MKIIKNFLNWWNGLVAWNNGCSVKSGHDYGLPQKDGIIFDEFIGLTLNKQVRICKHCKKRLIWMFVGTWIEEK